MVSGDINSGPQKLTRSYLIMKANSEEALILAEDWWKDKTIPNYIKVHSLKTEEIEEFVNLYNRCFLASSDPFCPLSIEDAMKLESEGIFVASLWGKLSGFIACFVEKTEDSIYGEITGLGVLPSRRRKGVATALIRQASAYFIDAGVEEMFCEVFETNIPSQMLITAYGFKQVGRREIPSEQTSDTTPKYDLPGGKIMRRLGLKPRLSCETCRTI